MESRLSRGSLRSLLEEGDVTIVKQGVTVQLKSWKEVPSNDGKGARMKLQISDGDLMGAAVGVGELADALQKGDLTDNGVFTFTEAQVLQKSPAIRILVIKNAKVLASTAPKMFGNPSLHVTGKMGPSDEATQRPPPLSTSNPPVQVNGGQRRPMGAAESGPAKKAKVEMPAGFIEIQGLNPYQDKWKIRARVTGKEELRDWSNARGSGSLFNMELTDHSGQIRATAFKEDAQRLYPIIVQGKVYDISGGRLKPANKKFNSTNCDYEITFGRETTVTPVEDGFDSTLPDILYNFTSIGELINKAKDDMVDVIGVLKSVGEATKLTSRAGKDFVKRDLVIADDSQSAVSLTLFGQTAENFQSGSEGRVLAVKGVKIGDYGGVSLSTVSGSRIELDPTTDRASELAGWWLENPEKDSIASLTTRSGASRDPTILLIDFVNSFGYGQDPNKSEYFNIRGTILNIKAAEALYKACPTENCKKRVVDNGGETYRCEKCGQDYDKFKFAAMIQLQIMDLSESHWLTIFGDENCLAITGKSPQDLGQLKETNPEEYESLFNNLMFRPFHFRVSAKQETYNDNTSAKWRLWGIRRFTVEDEDQYIKQLEEGIRLMKNL